MLRLMRGSHLQGFRKDYESFLGAVYRHTPNPGRVFVDGLKFNSRLAALVAAGFPVGGVIHLYRDPVDFVVSSMRNTGKSGWGGLSEHALRYRLYHARARQVSRSMPELVLHYEHLADDIDSQLERLFRFLAVQPMTVSQLQEYFDQEWHFMGNASLFGFDGIIKASRHRLEPAPRAFVRALARRAGG
jgi:hypothetical protein